MPVIFIQMHSKNFPQKNFSNPQKITDDSLYGHERNENDVRLRLAKRKYKLVVKSFIQCSIHHSLLNPKNDLQISSANQNRMLQQFDATVCCNSLMPLTINKLPGCHLIKPPYFFRESQFNTRSNGD